MDMKLGLDPKDAMAFWLWVARLWPIILPLVFLALRRSVLGNPVAFAVFGALICFGVQWVVGQVSPSWLSAATAEHGLAEQVFDIALNGLVRSVLVSMGFGLVLLWWFYQTQAEGNAGS